MLKSVNKIFNTSPKIRMITSNFHTSKPVFGWIQDYYVSYGVLLPREEIYKIGKITKNGEIKSYFPNNFELDGEFNKKLFELL